MNCMWRRCKVMKASFVDCLQPHSLNAPHLNPNRLLWHAHCLVLFLLTCQTPVSLSKGLIKIYRSNAIKTDIKHIQKGCIQIVSRQKVKTWLIYYYCYCYYFELMRFQYKGIPPAATGKQKQKQTQREEHAIVCVCTNHIICDHLGPLTLWFINVDLCVKREEWFDLKGWLLLLFLVLFFVSLMNKAVRSGTW